MMKIFLVAATAIMLIGSPALAQTYGPGGVGPRYENQYNGPGWNDPRRYGRPGDAYAQSPGGGRRSRSPNTYYDRQGDLIGRNPVLPGRW
jgi:hypothetical protein